MTVKWTQAMLVALCEMTGDKSLDPGDVDNEWGPKTMAAVKSFQKAYGGLTIDGYPGTQTDKAMRHALCYGMPIYDKVEEPDEASEDAPVDIPDAVNEDVLDTGYPYFSLAEFACQCSDPNCEGKKIKPSDALLTKLVDIRVRFGAPVTISSGVRCPKHNAEVGGVSNSYHLTGRAADIAVRGVSADKLMAYCSGLQLHYYYNISGDYVHVDI